MAWEWVPTASVGAIGIVLTFVAGKQGRDHAERVARDRSSHERTLAEEARRQQRLENAYIELLDMAEKVGYWAQFSYPILEYNPPQPQPELPDLPSQARTEALVKGFGSRVVLHLMTSWRKIVKDMLVQHSIIQFAHSQDQGQIALEARKKFFDLKEPESRAREAIGDQVSAELGHRTYRPTDK